MKITLKKKSTRILRLQLENKQQGYNLKEIKVLDKLVNKLFIIGYDDELDQAILDNNQDKILEIDKNISGEDLNIELNDDDLSFIKKEWDLLINISGRKDIREVVMEIDEAING